MSDKNTTQGQETASTSSKTPTKSADTKPVTTEQAEEVKKVVKKGKSKRKSVLEGKVYIQCTFNNTIVSITDMKGDVLAWSSAGSNGFKGAKKATPYAAQVSAEAALNKVLPYGLEKVHVYVKGVGAGREQAVRGLMAGGSIAIETITDLTPVAHNGCRPRKSRRV